MFLPKPAVAVDAGTLGIGGDFHDGGAFGGGFGGGGGGTRIDLPGGTTTKRAAAVKTQDREQNETTTTTTVAAIPTIHPSQLYEVDDDGNYIHQKLIDSMQQQQHPSTGGNEQATTKVENNNMSLEDMLAKSNKMVEITQDDIRGSYNPLLANERAIQNTNDMGGSLGKVSGTARAKNQVTSLVHDARQAELKLAQQQGMRHRTMAKSKYGW
jgi:hypothetical protein